MVVDLFQNICYLFLFSHYVYSEYSLQHILLDIHRNRDFYRMHDVRPPFTYASLIRQVNIEYFNSYPPRCLEPELDMIVYFIPFSS